MSSPPGRLPYPPPPAQAPRSRWRRRALLIAAGTLVLTAAAVGTELAFVHREDFTDVPPAHTVAAAYWAAVQRRSLVAMRRLLCDDDRVMLASVDDRTLLRTLFPPGHQVLGYTITGQRDQASATVVLVEVVHEDAGKVSTVTRVTPVVEKNGMYTVCFHSVGLYPGS